MAPKRATRQSNKATTPNKRVTETTAGATEGNARPAKRQKRVSERDQSISEDSSDIENLRNRPETPAQAADFVKSNKLIHDNYDYDDDEEVSNVDHQPEERPEAPPLVTGGIIPKMANFTATVNLECNIDLKMVAMNARNVEYNPKRFAAVIMRIRDPQTTALVFSNGKMVVTGAKSEDLAKLGGRKCAKILEKLEFTPKFTDFTVRNVVGTCSLPFVINIEELAKKHSNFTSYEPELFPALMYHLMRPRLVLMIFVSGKVIITGAKSREDIYQAFAMMYPVFVQFKGASVPVRQSTGRTTEASARSVTRKRNTDASANSATPTGPSRPNRSNTVVLDE